MINFLLSKAKRRSRADNLSGDLGLTLMSVKSANVADSVRAINSGHVGLALHQRHAFSEATLGASGSEQSFALSLTHSAHAKSSTADISQTDI